jgi:ubiquinone/menaquinone biosynthesis C-methylase UbiE
VGLRASLAKQVNDVLRPLRVQVVSGTSPDPAIQNFISARATMAAARKAGLPLGAYVDKAYVTPGATPDLVRAMLKLAGLEKYETVCEIGPGTGRFAEEITAAVHPGRYEMYETARDWLPRLRTLPNGVLLPCDGRTLGATPDASVDLVHAQKVFVYTEVFVTMGYVQEMARVVRPGGAVALDIMSEDCMDDDVVRVWTRERTIYRPVPRQWLVDYLDRRGLELVGSYFTPMPPGRSELLVFRRR